MYLDYFGLTEKPFSLTPDPKYFFASGAHAEARDLLRYGIREKEGFMCFVGGTGTGKTTLLRTVLEDFGDEVVTALVLNPFLSEEDLLRIILVDFGICTREELASSSGGLYSKQHLIDRLNEHLMALSVQGRTAVLVIDEAQNLPLPVLEQIRLLSNLETSKAKLLQIVLAGQLGLRDLLATPQLSQLAQRISVRYTIQPLTTQEIGRYIDHRLRIAGSTGDIVFTDPAVQRVFRLSSGVPRLVNLIADRSLLASYSQRTTHVTPEVVQRAAEALDLDRPGVAPPVEGTVRRERGGWFKRLLAGAAVVGTVMVGGYMLLQGGEAGERRAQPVRAEGLHDATPAAGSSRGAKSPASTPAQSVRPVASQSSAPTPHAGPAAQPQTLAPERGFTVYLSSFRSPSDGFLVQLRSDLSVAGYDSFLVEATVPGQGTLHRLVVGDFGDQASAQMVARRLREEMRVPHAAAVATDEIKGS